MSKEEVELKPKDEQELEILKAVAQAWHGRSGTSRPATDEFGACPRKYNSKPTRFKLQAMNKLSTKDTSSSAKWDFGQSLWDSYEIVAVSRRLEAGLVLDHQFSTPDELFRVGKRRKESKNSLRNLFNRMSLRRYNDADIPHEYDT
ncbi:uncharacterized protein LOC131145560 [Malania oleifera]|uniref:uncharacterized protein LOC131145560 n=1 Tax=Malania oleifera TaxID=397392 RepID=UPI0025ADD715|nr:uncharacterized protein LOC131145560 [Malania oleifera]